MHKIIMNSTFIVDVYFFMIKLIKIKYYIMHKNGSL